MTSARSPAVAVSRDYLLRQLDTAWKLADYHLAGLTTEECLWRPAREGLHVQRDARGQWRAEWPVHEGYEIGPPSIAWLTWHMALWWSMVHDHSFGPGTLTREAVFWPGTADGVRLLLDQRYREWRTALERLTDADLESTALARWPYQDRPFGDVVAWANVELTKNAAEIGYARFLYAVRASG